MNCFMGCALGVMSKLLAEPKITGFLLKFYCFVSGI